MFGFLLGSAVAVVLGAVSYWQVRNFVRGRLRYVDAIHNPVIPVAAAVGTALVALPVVMLVPFVGVGTAIALGAGVGIGVSAGVRDIRRSLPPGS